MSPLVAIAINLLPQVLDTIRGDRTGKAAAQVAEIVRNTLGTTDDQAANQKIASDPVSTAVLRERLLNYSLAQEQIKFQNTQDARLMQRDLSSMRSATAWVAPALSLVVTVGFFLVLLLFIFFKSRIDSFPVPALPRGVNITALTPEQIDALPLVSPSDFAIQIINISVGALAAAFATVISFWLGSSSGSQSKDQLMADLQTSQSDAATQALDKATNVVINRTSGSSAPTADVSEPTAPVNDGSGGMGTKPAPARLIGEVLRELITPHRKFPGSVSWALQPRGIAIDGSAPSGSAGVPTSVARIWSEFGQDCANAAQRYGVPVELIIATIMTESSGNPAARREEPQIKDASIGLMQTLLSTAREATGRPGLTANDLLDPRTSIDAGTAYIARQRGDTHFDPVLVPAAYNAGSLRLDDADRNRWKLHCFPKGTGEHIDRFVTWFNDCMVVSARDGWGKNGVPSFVAEFASTIRDNEAPKASFPPRPAFDPLLSTEERQQLFGAFTFDPDPQPDNPEHIQIKGTWEHDNIVDVQLPFKTGMKKLRFHRLAAEQLKNLWRDWETAGLLDHIDTFDGAYVPRFMRGKKVLSNHAFGTAFDINAATNPIGKVPAAQGEKGCVYDLVPIANKNGFFWGGHFKSRPDGMHFEIAKLL